jgi:hypothetical protein
VKIFKVISVDGMKLGEFEKRSKERRIGFIRLVK